MNWPTIVWSMGAAACFTLAAMYGLVWFSNRNRALLLFVITAAAAGSYAFLEMRMMFAQSPEQLGTLLRWGQLPLSVAVLSLMGFVWLYLQAGRPWLAWTICALRVAFLVPVFAWGGNSTLRAIPQLEYIEWFGQSLAIMHGRPNPWSVFGYLTTLLAIIFIADAGVAAWRRGDRRKAVVISGGSVFFLTTGLMVSALVVWAGLRFPPAIGLYYQALVAVMAYELSRDVLRASQLAHNLQASEARNLAIVRAVPDLMFLQSSDGVYLDCHAPHPEMLFAPPDHFLGKNMRDVLPALVLRDIDPVFRTVGSEPIVVEYQLPMPDGNRWYEARLVRNANDQILTLVRDVTEAKRAAADLRESEAGLQASNRQIRELAGHLIESQEAERARIARDLHDDLSQQIAGLSIALSGFKRRVAAIEGAAELPGEIGAIQQRAVDLAHNVRNLSHDLHPSVLVHGGLVAALSAHCAELARTQRVAVTFTSAGDFNSVSTASALCLYRVAQEALRNVVTHAAATRADVRLARDGEHAELTIEDDGKGFTMVPGRDGRGLGLVSINERVRLCGGTVSIVTELTKGTRVRALVPVGEAVVSLGAR